MNFDDTGPLISGFLIGTFGLAAFIYRKRAQRSKWMGVGLGLTIIPWFVSSMLMLWLLAAAGGAGLALLPSND
jgi:hypothetical protein